MTPGIRATPTQTALTFIKDESSGLIYLAGGFWITLTFGQRIFEWSPLLSTPIPATFRPTRDTSLKMFSQPVNDFVQLRTNGILYFRSSDYATEYRYDGSSIFFSPENLTA